ITRTPPLATLSPYTTLFRSGNKVTNTGTLTKLTGSTNPAYVYVAFDNDGAARVGSGNLNLNAGSGGVSTGSFEAGGGAVLGLARADEHTSELQSRVERVCRL